MGVRYTTTVLSVKYMDRNSRFPAAEAIICDNSIATLLGNHATKMVSSEGVQILV